MNTNPIQIRDNGHWIGWIVNQYEIAVFDSEPDKKDNEKYREYAT
jgi:hypothetical protein